MTPVEKSRYTGPVAGLPSNNQPIASPLHNQQLASSLVSLKKENDLKVLIVMIWVWIKTIIGVQEKPAAICAAPATPTVKGKGGGGGGGGGSSITAPAPAKAEPSISIPDTVKRPHGLQNKGILCWLNSSLQLLYHDSELLSVLRHVQQARPSFVTAFEVGKTNYDIGSLQSRCIADAFKPFWKEVLEKQQDVAEAWEKMIFSQLPNQVEVKSFAEVKEFHPEVAPYIFTRKYQDGSEAMGVDYRMCFKLHPGVSMQSAIERPEDNTQGSFARAPKHLFFEFNRFMQDETGQIKRHNAVTPVPKELSPVNGHTMELNYFVMHSGTYEASGQRNSGHYWCCLKKDGYWFEINDRQVKPISEQKALEFANSPKCTFVHYKG